MTHIDQFESVFRAADKPVFHHRPVDLTHVLVVTDAVGESATGLFEKIRSFLSVVPGAARWTRVDGDGYRSVGDLLSRVEADPPDLIVTYRHLHSEGWRWPYGLGEHLEVLTQVTPYPILVIPHPDARYALPHSLANTDRVMAITDHLAGDDRLVNYAVTFTMTGGTCDLTHIEDGHVFERYLAAFARIPEFDTDEVRALLLERLLADPTAFIDSCRRVLLEAGVDIRIETVVRVGHRLSEYASLIEERAVDLLVLNTKDHDQMAMHGLAHPLAVELRQVPLLML
ncbi:MAG: hypothetical protein KDC38_15355 [Planctomycetes bacterium]|nr:hypothetical protein [Planctomycetota bacterium]